MIHSDFYLPKQAMEMYRTVLISTRYTSIDISLRVKWRTQAAEAIHFIDREGVIHSDLRPDNFLLHTVGGNKLDLLLCDFVPTCTSLHAAVNNENFR
jgi:serine/threonine protein kinase